MTASSTVAPPERANPPREARGDVLVLCYHAVSERWPADLSTTPALLRQHLEFLVERGYRGMTFSEAVESPPGSKAVVVTFDDAFRSVLELALPVLSSLSLPGTVFVPTDFPDSGRPLRWPGIDHWMGTEHEPELTPLSWSELDSLAARGWEIGSHTCSHPRLPELDEPTLLAELADSKRKCEERLGRACDSLAYPYGAVDGRVAAAAAAAGYTCAATLPARFPPPEPLLWPRVGVYRTDDGRRFRLKASPLMRRLRASRLWSLTQLRLR